VEEGITKLTYQDKEIILVGTAHVSKQSVELVKEVINSEQPDSVCVELDEDRYRNIMNPKLWENTDIVKVIKDKRVGFLVVNLILSSYQKRIAKQLDTAVGQEMIQAIKEAEAIEAELVLADRKIQITFLRIWRGINFWEKIKLLFNLLLSFDDEEEEALGELDIQEMMQADMLEAALAGINKDFPKIAEVLIHERDQYLANKIKNAAGPKVVAVLGAAHVPGVKTAIFEEQDLDKLTSVPKNKSVFRFVGWIIPIVIIGLLVYAFALNIQTGLQQLATWIIWNGALAAIFTALALGHPFSIAVAFVTAPFTSLNPMLACGWFAGLVEATMRKPTVEDVHNIGTDIFSFKGWFFRNRFLRIILVICLANLGSSLGTFVAGYDIIKNFY
jgi:pheromone shutdown-related protein TraB